MASNENKRQFIEWLIKNFKHVHPTVNFLMKYLASHPELLDRIEFSDASKYAPNGLFISYQENPMNPFVYYKGPHKYTDSNQAFHDIRLNQLRDDITYYIELDIPNYYQEVFSFDIYKNNPYIPAEDHQLDQLDYYLTQLSSQTKLKDLEQQFDQAIERSSFEEAEALLKQIHAIRGELS